jgi:hypothetical protein
MGFRALEPGGRTALEPGGLQGAASLGMPGGELVRHRRLTRQTALSSLLASETDRHVCLLAKEFWP